MKKQAFTLAEVLITLVIIGIIGALTVPSLIQRTQKQEYVSALKKAYSTLSQAANRIIAENGSPKADKNGETWFKDRNAFYNMYKKYLSNVKECSNEGGCLNHRFLYLSKNSSWNFGANSGYSTLVLADGSQLVFDVSINKKCDHSQLGAKEVCGYIWVDVNGEKKPNVVGRDVFLLVLKENGLFPSGCDIDGHCTASSSGAGCACKVLREGAMNY